MKTRVFADKFALARAAASHAADAIRRAIHERGKARILASARQTSAEFLAALTAAADVSWRDVELFHLDELVGLPAEHPGSSRRYLFDQLIHPVRIGRYHLLDAEHDPDRTCREEGEELRAAPIDVAWASLSENGHLAFNEPPADFSTEKPYGIVRVDETSRRELVREGRFASIAEVPDRAISISLRQLLKATAVLCIATGAEWAEAVKRCVEGPVSPLTPASILQTHADATIYLDRDSARLLTPPRPLEA